MSYGIDSTGFNAKRLDVILEEKKEAVRAVFGADIILDPSSPDGQLVGLLAAAEYELWQALEKAYGAFNPRACSGVILDNLVALNGLVRLEATHSVVVLTATGTEGAVILQGTQVQDTAGQLWEIYQGGTIGAGGTVEVLASSVGKGPVAAAAESITSLVSPIFGVSSITNDEAAVLGRNRETDAQLRARREQSVAFPALSVLDGIYAAVAAVSGVDRVRIIENDTDTTLVTGQTPHSIRVVVAGGADADIARAIYWKKAAGIEAFGAESEEILDSQGLPHLIGFSRPTEVEIFIRVDLTTFSNYPSNGGDLIRQAFLDYASGSLVDGVEINLGDDVIYSRMYTPPNTVQGHQIDELYISTSDPAGPGDTSNITILDDEVAVFKLENILVND